MAKVTFPRFIERVTNGLKNYIVRIHHIFSFVLNIEGQGANATKIYVRNFFLYRLPLPNYQQENPFFFKLVKNRYFNNSLKFVKTN